jgi:hypothetical protein
MLIRWNGLGRAMIGASHDRARGTFLLINFPDAEELYREEGESPTVRREMQMAIPQRIRSMITAQPFKPFIVNLVGGTSFTIRHPENAAASIDGREMTVYDEDGPHYIEMLMVDLIEPVPSAADSKNEGNGS